MPEWNEFWIEPAEESESGDWVYAGGETEDGNLIVSSYQNEDSLRQYFEDNQLTEVGHITQYHGDGDESDFGYDDNGTGHNYDGNESDYGYDDNYINKCCNDHFTKC